MTVYVRIFGGLQRFTQGAAEMTLDVLEGTTAWDVVLELAIPVEEVWFAAVGGVRVRNDYVLEANDRVDIFAPVGGG